MAKLSKETQGEYDLFVGDSPYRDMVPFFRNTGGLVPGTISPIYSPQDIAEEESGIRLQEISSASSHLERTRQPIRGSLRRILKYAFDRFDLPKSGGVDIGSGATGEMVEELLPDVCAKSTWAQIDVNQYAVDANKLRHPYSTIMQCSYHNIGIKNLPIVTGLSSLDATSFVDDAIEEIRSSLADGGYLLHVQDVRPGRGYGMREMKERGIDPPYEVEFIAGTDNPLTYFDANSGDILDVGELFRNNLGRAIQNNEGMELCMNDWVTVRRDLKTPPALWYFMNMLLKADPYFDPGDNGPIEDVSAIVTVARRV